MRNLALQQDFTKWDDLKSFVENQYDIRLDNLLKGKFSEINHLESGLKNKVIMRKQQLVNIIKAELFIQ